MKKYKYLTIFLPLLLTGCNYINQIDLSSLNYQNLVSDETKLDEALSYITLNVDTTKIVTNIMLSSSSLYSASVTYSSSDETHLSIQSNKNDIGRIVSYTGKVTRDTSDVNLNLIVTVTINSKSKSKEIPLTILKKSTSTVSELPLAFTEDFSSYKTGLELSSYYTWQLSKGEGGCISIVDSIDSNINDLFTEKVAKITSRRLSSDYTYDKKINAGDNKKCVLEGYFLLDGETNGVSFETLVGTKLASSFTVSTSEYSYSKGGNTTKVTNVSPEIGIWTKFRITYSTANGYYAVQIYDYKSSSLIDLTPSYSSLGATGTSGTMDTFRIRVKHGVKQGATYISSLHFDSSSSGNINENIGTNPNRSNGIGRIENYQDTILELESNKTTYSIPEFIVHNRFDDSITYTKDSDYTVTSSSTTSKEKTTYSYIITLLSTNEKKTLTQNVYFDNDNNVAEIENFKASYLKPIKDTNNIVTGSYITITGQVIRGDSTLYYLVLNKGSNKPTIDEIKNPSTLSSYVTFGSKEIKEREISINTSSIDIAKEYDVYAITVNSNGNSQIYSSLSISTLVNISTCEEFYDMSINIDTKENKFRLINDLDFSSYYWNFDVSNTLKFEGELDGQGYTIKNLNISSTSSKVGIFYNLAGTIKNINFENCSVEGKDDCGILAGNIYSGTIENVNFISCSVNYNEESEGSSGYFGIACGRNRGSGSNHYYKNINILSCSIKAPKYIGLLTAGIESGVNCQIDNISIKGNIDSEGAAIGMIGRNRGTTTINNGLCFLNIINAKKEVGTLAGHNKEGGRLVVNNFFSDLTIQNITQVNYFNSFIGSHDASTSSYSYSNVYYVNEDYSSLSDSITPDVKAISVGTSINVPSSYSQRFFEENAPFGIIDVSTIFSYSSTYSTLIVQERNEDEIQFTADEINSYIDKISDTFTLNNRYYIIKAKALYSYVIEEEKSSVNIEKLNKAIEEYNKIIGSITGIISTLEPFEN